MTIHNHGRLWAATVLWRYLGKLAAVTAGGILIALIIIHGESWAIQQAPLLLTDSALAGSPDPGCSPDDSADAGALPVAILH